MLSLLTWGMLTLRSSDIAAAAINFGSGGRHRHVHCPECLAMIGADPNKMRLGKLGACLAFRHASWRAISQ
jgi:hypothetical protein